MAAHRIITGILASVICFVFAAAAPAADPRQQYLQAESCYRKLREHPSRQKYRDQWLKCIRAFDAVHIEDPDGTWAAAGLYMAGNLYVDLSRKSYLAADRQEGIDRYQRIIKRHPRSAYQAKAKAALSALGDGHKAAKKARTRRLDPKSGDLRRIEKRLVALAADKKRRRYRHNWQKLIDASLAVYRRDPGGPAAPAALYTTGRLYEEMAVVSRLKSDRREAADYYSRVSKHFPTSAYVVVAEKRLAGLSATPPPKKAPAVKNSEEKNGDATEAAKKRYLAADAARQKLDAKPGHKKYRDKWQTIIDGYLSATAAEPGGPWAAAGLYQAGVQYLDLYEHSYAKRDREAGIELLSRVARDFPDSRYREKARRRLAAADPGRAAQPPASAGDDPLAKVIAAATAKPPVPPPPKQATAATATITGLRYWSNPRYTRVVIDADQETAFGHRLLNKDPNHDKPQRLYVDLAPSRLGATVEKNIPINDNLLSDARAGQNTDDTVRVVIDIKSFRNYKIFSLKNPFRVVIDVWGKETRPSVAKTSPKPKAGQKLPTEALAKQLSLGVRRIVIDPGHGGKDYGAPGYLKGVHEKRIVLSISKRLASMIRKEIGCEVVLTRNGDTFLPLEERTAFANTRNADLFISIHTNAARDKRAYGIETYFLNLATDDDAIRVAALENATSTKNISDLQAILTDLMQNAKINESSRLATHVHDNITRTLKRHYSRIRDKGVKQAPFYVLLGAQMPAVLVETSFISNPRECKRLTDPNYQKRLCEGIVAGIKAYIDEANPSAFHRPAAADAGKG
jgi:N-acetylmuramoyl-L-alanine amidase